MPYGPYSFEHVAFRVTDAAAVSKTITRTKGARGLGSRVGLNREPVQIMEDGRQVGALSGDEQARQVTITVTADSVTKDAIDFMLARGSVYSSTGTAPMRTVDPIGQRPAVELVIQVSPPTGTPWTRTIERAYLSVDETADNPAEYALTWDCYGTEVDS